MTITIKPKQITKEEYEQFKKDGELIALYWGTTEDGAFHEVEVIVIDNQAITISNNKNEKKQNEYWIRGNKQYP